MKINTYAVNCNDAWLNTDGDDISGSYVKYKDHQDVVADLEAKCSALAAENAALKRNLEGTAEFCYSELPETPATDSFLAEVRASAIEGAIAELKQLAERSEKEAPIAAEHHRSAALYLQLFVAQLRQEAAQ